MGFPGGAVVRNLPANARDSRDVGSVPGLGRSPVRKWQRTPVFLPGKSRGQRSLVGYNSWGQKESDMTEHITEHNTASLSYSLLYQFSG